MIARLEALRRLTWGVAAAILVAVSLSGCIANLSGIDEAAMNARAGITAATSAVVEDGSLPTDPAAWIDAFRKNGGAGDRPRVVDASSAGFAWSLPQEPVAYRTRAWGADAVLDVISAGVGYGHLEPVQVFAYVCAEIVVDTGPRLTARAGNIVCPSDIVEMARLQDATAVTLDGNPRATWTPQPPATFPGG